MYSVTSVNNCCKPNSWHKTNQCIGNVYIFSMEDSQGFVCQEVLSVQLPANEPQTRTTLIFILVETLFCPNSHVHVQSCSHGGSEWAPARLEWLHSPRRALREWPCAGRLYRWWHSPSWCVGMTAETNRKPLRCAHGTDQSDFLVWSVLLCGSAFQSDCEIKAFTQKYLSRFLPWGIWATDSSSSCSYVGKSP